MTYTTDYDLDSKGFDFVDITKENFELLEPIANNVDEIVMKLTSNIQLLSSADVISGDELTSELGITQGSSQYSDTSWIMFPDHLTPNGKQLLVPLKTIRHSISWDAIYNAGAVYGTGSDISDGEQWMLDNDDNYSSGDRVEQDATVSINGRTYKVRLMRGAGDDPTDSFDDSDRGSLGADNEWNALMLPIHEKARTGNWNYTEYAPSSVDDWAIYFSDADLLTHNDFGNGSRVWCQETRDTDTFRRVVRGDSGVSNLDAGGSSSTSHNAGWRPVLEKE